LSLKDFRNIINKPNVLCVNIQDEKYIKYVESLRHMLLRYNKLLASLDQAEVSDPRVRPPSYQHAFVDCGKYLVMLKVMNDYQKFKTN